VPISKAFSLLLIIELFVAMLSILRPVRVVEALPGVEEATIRRPFQVWVLVGLEGGIKSILSAMIPRFDYRHNKLFEAHSHPQLRKQWKKCSLFALIT